MPWFWRRFRRHNGGLDEPRAHRAKIREQQPEVDHLVNYTRGRGNTNHFREAVQELWEANLRGGTHP